MKFRSFFWVLIAATASTFLIVLASLGWTVAHSSLILLEGGVNTFPEAAIFLPKRSPGVVSLLTNPDKLYAWREVSLPLSSRRRDRQEWQKLQTNLLSKIGLDYQQDFRPWLGDEITFGITSLDYDRNPDNGNQSGYLLIATSTNPKLAQSSLHNFYHEQNATLEQYNGVDIMAVDSAQKQSKEQENPIPWSCGIAGKFVLFSNQAQIIKDAINQAQATDLNLTSSEDYQLALSQSSKPHLAIAYGDVLSISTWLDKTAPPVKLARNPAQILGAFFSLRAGFSPGIATTATLTGTNQAKVDSPCSPGRSFLDNPELQKILESLPFDQRDSAYINLQAGTSFLEEQIPLYKVSKLAVKSLLPHLKAIAIKKIDEQDNDNISRARILFELDG